MEIVQRRHADRAYAMVLDDLQTRSSDRIRGLAAGLEAAERAAFYWDLRAGDVGRRR